MKNRNYILSAMMAVLFSFSGLSIAQEIIPIPPAWPTDSDYEGVINRFIMADTVGGGERKHPNAIYELQRGEYYDINHRLTVDFNLSIVAAPNDPTTDADDAPPMISRGLSAGGSYISGLFDFIGDSTYMYFRGILFNGAQDDNEITTAGASLFGIYGTFHRFEADSCIFSGWNGNLFNSRESDRGTFIFKNSIFRNGVGLANPWQGNIYSSTTQSAHNELISFVNNTFFNYSSYQLLSWGMVDRIEYIHNTLFNSTLNAHWAPYLINAKISDNIFYNYQTVGQTTFEIENGYWDKGTVKNHPSSICKLDLIDPEVLFNYGITEADRKVEYSNNVYAWSNDVTSYWATHKDSSTGAELEILPVTFMNDYTDSMFKSLGDFDYPDFVAENNLELNPGFDAGMEAAVWAKDLYYIKLYRRYGYQSIPIELLKERHYAPSGIFWDLIYEWPLPEDLTYTNSTVLTHADGGFPAGDLNWYPTQKAAWEDWTTDIEQNDGNMNRPMEYTLSQNYPNPFNPTTTISFEMPVKGMTSLTVYNVLGQKVATVVNEQLAAGTHSYKFEASNLASGIYVYKLQTKNYSKVMKMMLLK